MEYLVIYVLFILFYGSNDEKGMKVIGFGCGVIGIGLIGEVEDSWGLGYVIYYWY